MASAKVLAHALGRAIVVSEVTEPHIPPLMADRGLLETALINLGTDASDARPDGGDHILSASAETVSEGDAHPAGLAPT
jgi:hypothetical protein